MPDAEQPSENTHKSNVPEFSVGELAFSLKKTIEDVYGRVRVRGEIGRVTFASSGHVYTNLKDDKATIDAVCWKGVASRLSIRPEEGMDVICTGKLSTYPGSSKYQLIIDSMELAGEGALLKMLEERRKKLAAEGLYDEARKKALPFLPNVIGVVTSPTGAVIRDILHRVADRFPRHVILWPVMVQGEGAANQIAAAIDGFNKLSPPEIRDAHSSPPASGGARGGVPKPDILIVGRGGGSLEDLMAFNEEIVVRAIANSDIPVISAVGHETDTTLADFAADLRAPTPTGAAEMAVPVRMNLIAQVLEDEQRLIGAMSRIINEYGHKLDAYAAKLGDPARLLEVQEQRLDHTGDKINAAFNQYLSRKREAYSTLSIPSPKSIIHNAELVIGKWTEQLVSTGKRALKDHDTRIAHAGKMLEAYSFENVLQRGFAVIQDAQGALITEAGQTSAGQNVHIRFKDKQLVDATIGKDAAPKKSSPKKPSPGTKQTSLF